MQTPTEYLRRQARRIVDVTVERGPQSSVSRAAIASA
jgi:hypothetical protein